jgi:DNA-binding CsgD family transcriptional regulator
LLVCIREQSHEADGTQSGYLGCFSPCCWRWRFGFLPILPCSSQMKGDGASGRKNCQRVTRFSGKKELQPTPRETEVLHELAHDAGLAETAKKLGIAFETARSHVRVAKRRLGVRTTSPRRCGAG